MNTLTTLTQQGRIWTARHWQQASIPAVSTGYAELDAVLPGGGWPLGAVSEVFYSATGMGELRLLLPALARISHNDDRWQLWLNPPLQPCGPALQDWQLQTERILLAYAKGPKDITYSLEKSLLSGGSQAIVAWVDKLDKALLRRIQLAAETRQVAVFMLRPMKYLAQPSIAALRVQLKNQSCLSIIKRRAGWPLDDIQIDLPLTRPVNLANNPPAH